MNFSSLPRLSLPAQLAIFLGCVLPLLWSLLIFDLQRIHEQITNNSRSQTGTLVQAFAEEVKSSVNSIDMSLVVLRDAWLNDREAFADIVHSRQAYLEPDVGFQVGIIDASGRLIFSSVDPDVEPIDLSDREHFRVHREQADDRLVISEPVVGRVSQRWTIQFTRPLTDDNGQFAGVIVLSVSPDYFSRFYQSIDLGKDSTISLLRRSGEYLARSPNPELALGKSSLDGPYVKSQAGDRGLFESLSPVDGIERLYGWRALPKGDLVVAVGQSLDKLFAPYREQRQAYIIAGTVISLLLALIGYFLLAGLRQRAAATAALIDSEARWKLALEGAGEGVWDWDIWNNHVQFSRRWKEILGYADNEVSDRIEEWMDRVYPDDAPALTQNLRAHLDGVAPTYLSEHRMRCRNGDWKWVLERGTVVSRASDGKPLRMVGTFSDITGRKQGEAALQESMSLLTAEQLRMKVILENSYDAFVAVDRSGHITDWNTKAELTFGWSAAEVIGKNLADVVVPEDRRKIYNEGFRRFTVSGKSDIVNTVIEADALHRSGKRIPVEVAIAGFHDGKGYVANAFIRDISKRKEAEKTDRERTRSLEEARKALQQSQKLEALGRLTGGIAHDFNNVLQTLTTGIQVALFSVKESGVRAALEAAQRAVDRGVELTRQLLVFGRAQDAHLKTIALSEQIRKIVPFLQGALPSDIEFKVNVPDNLWSAQIDPLQFELALLNLTMNARDAMPKGGCFTITATNETVSAATSDLAPGSYIHLVVSDTGEGMAPEVLAKALDPFFTTKEIGKGSGMGLPQAYGFAKQMGGTLSLHSCPGKGLEVSIYLPRSTQEAQPPGPQQKIGLKRAATPGGAILFVEDDALVRETVLPALEASGFKVRMANNGDEAARLLASEESIDLVFSDIVMPGKISGIDLADLVRERFPHIKIVLATGYSDRRVSFPDIRILAKPYDISTLVNTLNEELLCE